MVNLPDRQFTISPTRHQQEQLSYNYTYQQWGYSNFQKLLTKEPLEIPYFHPERTTISNRPPLPLQSTYYIYGPTSPKAGHILRPGYSEVIMNYLTQKYKLNNPSLSQLNQSWTTFLNEPWNQVREEWNKLLNENNPTSEVHNNMSIVNSTHQGPWGKGGWLDTPLPLNWLNEDIPNYFWVIYPEKISDLYFKEDEGFFKPRGFPKFNIYFYDKNKEENKKWNLPTWPQPQNLDYPSSTVLNIMKTYRDIGLKSKLLTWLWQDKPGKPDDYLEFKKKWDATDKDFFLTYLNKQICGENMLYFYGAAEAQWPFDSEWKTVMQFCILMDFIEYFETIHDNNEEGTPEKIFQLWASYPVEENISYDLFGTKNTSHLQSLESFPQALRQNYDPSLREKGSEYHDFWVNNPNEGTRVYLSSGQLKVINNLKKSKDLNYLTFLFEMATTKNKNEYYDFSRKGRIQFGALSSKKYHTRSYIERQITPESKREEEVKEKGAYEAEIISLEGDYNVPSVEMFFKSSKLTIYSPYMAKQDYCNLLALLMIAQGKHLFLPNSNYSSWPALLDDSVEELVKKYEMNLQAIGDYENMKPMYSYSRKLMVDWKTIWENSYKNPWEQSKNWVLETKEIIDPPKIEFKKASIEEKEDLLMTFIRDNPILPPTDPGLIQLFQQVFGSTYWSRMSEYQWNVYIVWCEYNLLTQHLPNYVKPFQVFKDSKLKNEQGNKPINIYPNLGCLEHKHLPETEIISMILGFGIWAYVWGDRLLDFFDGILKIAWNLIVLAFQELWKFVTSPVGIGLIGIAAVVGVVYFGVTYYGAELREAGRAAIRRRLT
jgi:hypothetical protein